MNKPILNQDERKALSFVSRWAGWHTFASNEIRTLKAIRGLESRGLVEVSNQTSQFRVKETILSSSRGVWS